MKILTAVLALLSILLTKQSSAGIIYEWKSINDETPRDISLQIEFDETTVISGSFIHEIKPTGRPYDSTAPQYRSGLLAFRLGFPSGLTLHYQRGSHFAPDSILYMDLRFESGGFLAGSMYVNDTQSHISMSGSTPFFTIHDADSDYPYLGAECGWATGVKCSGAKGQIRRTDIPEPGSYAILGLGLAAFVAARRRAK